jgi:hypothetical protein
MPVSLNATDFSSLTSSSFYTPSHMHFLPGQPSLGTVCWIVQSIVWLQNIIEEPSTVKICCRVVRKTKLSGLVINCTNSHSVVFTAFLCYESSFPYV